MHQGLQAFDLPVFCMYAQFAPVFYVEYPILQKAVPMLYFNHRKDESHVQERKPQIVTASI
jgi:hypothetical protein